MTIIFLGGWEILNIHQFLNDFHEKTISSLRYLNHRYGNVCSC